MGILLAAQVGVYPPNGGYCEEVCYTDEVVVTLSSWTSERLQTVDEFGKVAYCNGHEALAPQ